MFRRGTARGCNGKLYCVCSGEVQLEYVMESCTLYVQERYSKQRDKMLEAYFICTVFIYASLYILQIITVPRYITRTELKYTQTYYYFICNSAYIFSKFKRQQSAHTFV